MKIKKITLFFASMGVLNTSNIGKERWKKNTHWKQNTVCREKNRLFNYCTTPFRLNNKIKLHWSNWSPIGSEMLFSFNLSPQLSPGVRVLADTRRDASRLTLKPTLRLCKVGPQPGVCAPLPGLSCSISSSDGTACPCCCCDTNKLQHAPRAQRDWGRTGRQTDTQEGGKRAPPWDAVTKGAGS